MGVFALTLRFFHAEVRKLLLIIGLAVSFIILFQCFSFSYGKIFVPSPTSKSSIVKLVSNATTLNDSNMAELFINVVANDTNGSDPEEEARYKHNTLEANTGSDSSSEVNRYLDGSFSKFKDQNSHELKLKPRITQGKSLMSGYIAGTDDGSTKDYVELIAGKYSFWNRTGGADHFLVACHDWAIKLTKNIRSCIRALCNSNAAKGFEIGKDTTLPVTYIRSMEAPLENLGGKPPSERNILAFFAGGMHGYLRPILLQYWQNKESDMKIFGPMPRDVEGKRKYREHMKSSKYCICAKGYEVHTPRVVESIYYECVPVIISDNYVPPFFEVLNWEAFAIFVQEKDIPSLRNILLSIPEEKYLEMHARVKLVQQHFLWHKRPVKYDLFHMILHSVWYNRVFHIKTR
ncbi:putative glycosyltransferase isoform X2 [Gossypium australe]|uniref:Putative glycosyltransferase isoform X2 n=1 Tax=Gossypium australe TaxID=47621 RepID=A0A5B6X782_9ROSI|nr:putative glycosyltransferase isoform X2 [Gossypium australe]